MAIRTSSKKRTTTRATTTQRKAYASSSSVGGQSYWPLIATTLLTCNVAGVSYYRDDLATYVVAGYSLLILWTVYSLRQ